MTMTRITSRRFVLGLPLFSLLAAGVFLLCCTSPADARKPENECAVEVTLTVVGDSSPTWEIEDNGTLGRLKELFRKLEDGENNGETRDFQLYGFGGYELRAREGNPCDIPENVRVRDGYVYLEGDDGEQTVYQDTVGVDRFLNGEAHRRRVLDGYDPMEFIEY